MRINKFLSAVGAGIILMTNPVASQSTQVHIELSVDPDYTAEVVTISHGIGAPSKLLEPPAISESSVTIGISVGDGEVENSTISASWEGNLRTSFPLRLSTLFTGPIYVGLFGRHLADHPKPSDVSRACVGTQPSQVDLAFEMLFTCREMALQLETEVGRKWAKTYRTALQGWLAASYFLYTATSHESTDPAVREARITPYRVDPDLVTRLHDAVARDDRNPRLAWPPFQIKDARSLLQLIRDEDIRLVGWVPVLRATDLKAAAALNSTALEAIEAGGDGLPYGVTLELLTKNQAALESALVQ